MQSNCKIIQFPQSKIVRHSKSVQDIEKEYEIKVESIKLYHIQDTLELIIPKLLKDIEIAGFGDQIDDSESPVREDRNCGKDICLVIEAIKSLLMKYEGYVHPLQQIGDELFNITENDEIEFIYNKDNDGE